MKVLSLFAGMGGFDLAFELAGFDVVAQVEIEPYCKQVLKYNFPTAKQYGDIREVTGERILRDCGAIDLICGGFPCQDISSAGKVAGLDGERSGLWWEMHRLIGELRPTWVIAENVDALRNRGLNRVHASLEELGYQVWCFGIPASALGAPHQRKRLWIVGYSQSKRQRKPNNKANAGATGGQARCIPGGASYSPFAFPAGPGQQQYGWEEPRTVESQMGVTVDGLPRKLALRAIGNSIVPAIAYSIARTIGRMERVTCE